MGEEVQFAQHHFEVQDFKKVVTEEMEGGGPATKRADSVPIEKLVHCALWKQQLRARSRGSHWDALVVFQPG